MKLSNFITENLVSLECLRLGLGWFGNVWDRGFECVRLFLNAFECFWMFLDCLTWFDIFVYFFFQKVSGMWNT